MADQLPPQKPLFPRAWPFYNACVATIGAVMITVNVLVGANLWGPTVDKWVNVGLALLSALLIWLNERRRQLFGGNGHTTPENKPVGDLIDRVKPPDADHG
jgi:hypothetical protein